MTVRMRESTKAKLETLADHTQRSKSFLANDAIERYLDHELAIVDGIERGLDDMRAGRVTSHDDAMKQIRATIGRAQQD
jgi:predicted transcriptional regulator